MKHFRKLIAFALISALILSMPGTFVLADEDAPAVEEAVETAAPEEDAALTEEPPAAEETPDPAEETPDPAEEAEAGEPEDTEASEPEEEPGDAPDPEDDGEPEAAEEEAEIEEEEPEAPALREWVAPGNTDLAILGGGTTLWTDDGFYYSEGGVWYDRSGATSFIAADNAANLNLSDGWLYYTVASGAVRRVPASGGRAETVYSFDRQIDQLYVMGPELRFLAGGSVYSFDMETEALETLESPSAVTGLIPTRFGNLYLTGSARDYTLWAGTDRLMSGAEHCYTDGNWLVVEQNGEFRQTLLCDLFDGVCRLREYDLHSDELAGNGLSDEEQLQNEAEFLESEQYEQMQDALEQMTLDGAEYSTSARSAVKSTDATGSDLTQNQTNIILRARQMAEIQWTPVKWRWSWGGDDSSYVSSHSTRNAKVVATDGTSTQGWFKAGKTYQGVPYSQAVSTGYVGWDVSLETFIKRVNDSTSVFYSGYSTYSRTAPYNGSDCSGFVSWAWDVNHRCTCTSLLDFSKRITNDVQNLRIGDSLNNPNSHVVLVTDIGRDANGKIVSVEITEQTPCKMRVTCYGERIPGKTYENVGSLSYINTYYFSGGYSIYRRNDSACSHGVRFTKSSAIDLETTGYAPAPTVTVTVNPDGSAKIVELSHANKDAVIYYTLDGTEPKKDTATRYEEALEITAETTVRAIADCGSSYTGSYAVTYVVSVTRAVTPFVVLDEGEMSGAYVSKGSVITILNVASGNPDDQADKIFYTTDGSAPTKNSTPLPKAGIAVNGDMTLKAVALSTTDLISAPMEIDIRVGEFFSINTNPGEGGYMTGDYSALKGGDATIAIVPLQHYVVKDVLVDGQSVGSVTSYTFHNVTESHMVEAKFAVDIPFKDVKSSAWYAKQVTYAYANNLFAGTTDTEFSPNDNMTRGMFITVLGRYAGGGRWTDLGSWSGRLGVTNGSAIAVREQKTTADISVILTRTGAEGEHILVLSDAQSGYDNGNWYRVTVNGKTGYMRETMPDSTKKTLLKVYNGKFTDLPNKEYYTGYAQWASIEGIMYGVSDTQFGTNQYIRRQDICMLLYRYLTEYCHKTLPTSSVKFKDDADISSYARTAVYAMKQIGVVSGYEDGSFGPLGYATRAQVATMFANLSDWMAKNP